MSNIVGLDNDGNWKQHFETCDLVIEAVLENLDVKHAVLREMEEILPENAIFATNTSGLKVADIASVSKRPENVIGMHYFSPVDKMPLLEIIKTEQTSEETLSRAYDIGLRQGKTIIVTKDVAGFYVNRCLGPYLVEVMACIAEGAFNDVDKAMLKFGFPMGPLTLGDMVGIDVAAKIVPNLAGELGARVGGATTGPFDDLLSANLLGQKTKEGFYTYDDKMKKGGINPEATKIVQKYVKSSDNNTKPSVEEIGERCSSRFA